MAKPARISRDALLVHHLARGESHARAGRLAGVSKATVGRRLANPEFRQRVADERARLLESASARLAASTGEAVTALRHLLTSESDAVRLSAARAILDSATRLRDSVELERRLAALETKLN